MCIYVYLNMCILIVLSTLTISCYLNTVRITK